MISTLQFSIVLRLYHLSFLYQYSRQNPSVIWLSGEIGDNEYIMIRRRCVSERCEMAKGQNKRKEIKKKKLTKVV